MFTENDDDGAPASNDFSDLVEPTPAPQIFCDGIGPITIVDGLIHVTFWARQQRGDGAGFRRVIVARCTSQTSSAYQSVKYAGRIIASSMLDVIRKRSD